MDAIPDLYQAELDDELLTRLHDDILATGSVCEVLLKHHATQHVDEGGGVSTTEAFEQVRNGTVRAIQLTYTFNGELWRDTILRSGSGFRVVRMRADHEPPEATAP